MRHSFRGAAAVLLAASMCLAFTSTAFAGVVSGSHKAGSSAAAETTAAPAAVTPAASGSSAGDGIVSAPGGAVQPADANTGLTTSSGSAAPAADPSAPAAVSGSAQTVTAQTGSVSSGSTGSAGSVSVNSDYSLPGTTGLGATPGGVDLQGIFDGSDLDALGTGNTPADPILNQVHIATYKMMDGNGNTICYTATNDPGKGLFSASGFSRFYMVHSGVARLYYRTYSDSHGWSSWCTSKEITPSNTDGTKVQAIQIRVKGYAHTLNDIYYKVILNDGTVLDWAKNGQTAGTMGTDRYIVGIRVGFWHNTERFPYATKNLMAGCSYEGAYKDANGVHYSTYNGQPYTGWGYIDNTQYYFQNGAPAQGWVYADGYKYYFNADGSVCTDLEPIMGLQSSYQIEYNKATRTMYIMAADGANGYIIPFKTFNSTCGPDTPLGTYNTYAKYDVKFMHEDENNVAIYCKYLSRFYQGFLIHSILFYTSRLELDAITYNYIDDAASGGCIRLLTGDAYWVMNNCPTGTRVHVFEDQWNKGPVEKGACDQVIPRDQTWDPTDPSSAEAKAALAAAAQAEQARAEAIANGTATMTEEEKQLANALAASAN